MAPTAGIESENPYEETAEVPGDAARVARRAHSRSYLMCPPTYFDVVYAINDWMCPEEPVDRDRAMSQWSALADTYRRLGHEVLTIDLSRDFRTWCSSPTADSSSTVWRSAPATRSAERRAEAEHVFRWFSENRLIRPTLPRYVNEGEGDFLVVGDVILAGTGFRSDPRAHAEAAAHLAAR